MSADVNGEGLRVKLLSRDACTRWKRLSGQRNRINCCYSSILYLVNVSFRIGHLSLMHFLQPISKVGTWKRNLSNVSFISNLSSCNCSTHEWWLNRHKPPFHRLNSPNNLCASFRIETLVGGCWASIQIKYLIPLYRKVNTSCASAVHFFIEVPKLLGVLWLLNSSSLCCLWSFVHSTGWLAQTIGRLIALSRIIIHANTQCGSGNCLQSLFDCKCAVCSFWSYSWRLYQEKAV